MIMKNYLYLCLCAVCCCVQAQNTIDLSGTWDFGTGNRCDDTILLPGSMPQRLKGDKPSVETRWTASLYDSSYFHNPYMEPFRRPDNFKIPFFLLPQRHYVGSATYQRVFTLDHLDADSRYTLFLERPHITVRALINGREAGVRNSLSVADEWDITPYLQVGQNTITLQIDNDIRPVGVGPDSHSVTDQTQGNWNGVVGRMEIRQQPRIYIDDMQVFTSAQQRTAQVRLHVCLLPDDRMQTRLSAGLPIKYHLQGTLGIGARGKAVIHGDTTLVIPLKGLGRKARLWDEFSPFVYQLQANLQSAWGTDHRDTQFGIRDFQVDGRYFTVNGRRTLLRGTVENCNFPLTGYPPTDEQSWERVFQQCKDYGLNHIRFHSYCPPEAAFRVADRMGLYLQPEGPSWPNHGVKLGQKQVIDTYLMEETQRMVRAYGNHPSFCMMAAGNEPAGNWVPWVSRFVDYWRQTDPRRVYTGASVGGSWAWQPHNQYHVKAGVRGLDEWRRTAPESTYDFTARLDTVRQPFVCHEMGQWCAFPDLDEVSQYTGVYQATNYEIFRQLMQDHGMEQMGQRFLQASGRLQVLCYKHEMERILRTPTYAGFQMLGLNDYSGQGTALVGPLNVFWREKGYITPQEWREFCSPLTVLCRLPRFTYWNDESLSGTLEVSNFGQGPIEDQRLQLTLCDGERELQHITASEGAFSLSLQEVSEASQLTLRATLTGRCMGQDVLSSNHWDLWVYPRQTAQAATQEPTGIHICQTLDQEALRVLQQGGKVLVQAAGKVTYGAGIVQHFLPVFWNTSWFKMKPPHTTGLYVWREHPIFQHFPTQEHSDLQWWELVNQQQVMLLDRMPLDFQPLVQSIDTWFLSRKIGMLFEARVGEGRLVVTTFPLQQVDYALHPAIAQMRHSILAYMQSDAFQPQFTLAPERIQELFTRQTPPVDMFTRDMPDELKTK